MRKKQLFTLNRDGTLAAAATTDNGDEPVNHLTLAGFSVRLDDYTDYISTRNVSPTLWHHFLQVFRKNSPSNFKWHPTNIAYKAVDKLEATFDASSTDTEQILYDCFTHCRKGHLRTIFVVARRATCDKMDVPTAIHMFQHGNIFDTTTQQTEKTLLAQYSLEKAIPHILPKKHASEFNLFLAVANFCLHGFEDLVEEQVVETETKALEFCKSAVALAQTHNISSLERLWSIDAELQDKLFSIFSPPLAAYEKTSATIKKDALLQRMKTKRLNLQASPIKSATNKKGRIA